MALLEVGVLSFLLPLRDGPGLWGPASSWVHSSDVSSASGDGLSRCLPLCFPAGSECTTSCLDHNSESIILPVNVTVRDIPHWLNPTRVQVSDWEENDLVDHLHALVLH